MKTNAATHVIGPNNFRKWTTYRIAVGAMGLVVTVAKIWKTKVEVAVIDGDVRLSVPYEDIRYVERVATPPAERRRYEHGKVYIYEPHPRRALLRVEEDTHAV